MLLEEHMGKVSFSETFTGTITIKDVSVETWVKIKQFIAEAVGEEDKPQIVVMDTEPDVAALEVLQRDNGIPMMPTTEGHSGCYEAVWSILETAECRESGLDSWKWMTAREFMEQYPILSEYNSRRVGRVLTQMVRGGVIKKREHGEVAIPCYYLPVAEKPVEKPADAEFGAKLRAMREAHDITADELAEMIGYPKSVVLAWESGENALVKGTDGYTKIRTLFGDEFDAICAA